MNKKRITFIGTESPVATRNAVAGNCLRIVNLRHRNGSLQPVGEPEMVFQMADTARKIVYVHVCNNSRHHITYGNGNIYHEYDVDKDGRTINVNTLLASFDDELSSVTSLGNTLIVVCHKRVLYMLHKGNEYLSLGDRPPMPKIRMQLVNSTIFGEITAEYAISGKLEFMNNNVMQELINRELGYYYKIRDTAHENFYFIQPIAVRYALRLYDGSHILPSAPIIMCHYNIEQLLEEGVASFLYNENDDMTYTGNYSLILSAFKLGYYIEEIDLENWSDIVKGIDIFVTKEVPMFNEKEIEYISYTKQEENLYKLIYHKPMAKISEIEQTALEDTLYYKLASIENPQSIEAGVLHEIDHNIRPDLIIYQERLMVDTTNFCTIGARQSYIYNSRLHLADITQKYYEGYPATLFLGRQIVEGEMGTAEAYIRTTLQHIDGGSSDAVWRGSLLHFSPYLSPMLSYPDYNATAMEIVIQYNGYEYRKTFPLKSIENENRSSYINDNLADIEITSWENKAITDEMTASFPTRSESVVLYHHNRMNVSEAGNPFFFPAELTYSISGGTITGIAATIAALSQGQYGEFPLYIFTDEGIWAMQIGDGEVCYARSTPINREIVRSGACIVPTENAIIYATDNALSMISGAKSQTLLSFVSYPEKNFQEQLSSLMPLLPIAGTDSCSIPEFFAGSFSLGYLHTEKELIFCNPAINYNLVLHLPTQHIYRLSQRYIALLDGYNSLLAQNSSGEIYDLYRESPGTTEIALITRPIGDGDDYLRLLQVAWRMYGSHLNAALAITGSHESDGECGILHRATYNGYVAGHVPIRLYAPPYKYYRLLLTGVASADFHLDCADLIATPCKNNKLR